MNVNFIQEIVMTSARYDHLIKFAELCNSRAWALVLLSEKITVNRGFMTSMLHILYLYLETVHWDLKVLGMFWS